MNETRSETTDINQPRPGRRRITTSIIAALVAVGVLPLVAAEEAVMAAAPAAAQEAPQVAPEGADATNSAPALAAAATDPSICSGGSLTGREVNGAPVSGSDRGTVFVDAGAQVQVVGSVTNTASGLFTGTLVWTLSPFTNGTTPKGATTPVNVTWTNTGDARLVEVRMIDEFFGNAFRYTFKLTVTGSQPLSCNALLAEELLGGAQSRSVKNVACGQAQATANPVSTSTGNFWHTFEDLVIPGRGIPLALQRTYNAHPGSTVPNGPMGFGWTFNYGMSLSMATGTVTLTEEAGSRITFTGTGPTYTAPPRIMATLVRDVPSTGMFTVTRQAQETLVFDAGGRLASQRDLNGLGVSLSYDGSGHLATVTEDVTAAA